MNASSASLLSAVLTSACCLPALILLAFSLSSVTLGAILARYHWWFLGAGSIFLAYSYVLYFRERLECSTGGGCSPPQRRLTLISLAIGTLVVLGLAVNSLLPVLSPKKDVSLARAVVPQVSSGVSTIAVKGMTCFTCELHVKKVLGDIPGVKQVMASAADGTVEVVHDPNTVKLRDLVEAINLKTGYRACAPTSTSDATTRPEVRK